MLFVKRPTGSHLPVRPRSARRAADGQAIGAGGGVRSFLADSSATEEWNGSAKPISNSVQEAGETWFRVDQVHEVGIGAVPQLLRDRPVVMLVVEVLPIGVSVQRRRLLFTPSNHWSGSCQRPAILAVLASLTLPVDQAASRC